MAVKNLKLRNTYAGPKQESRNLGDSLGSRSCSWSVNRHRCFILIPPNSQLFILHAGFLGDRNKFGVGDEAIKCNMEVLPLFSPLDEADIDLRVYRNVLYFVGTRLGCCQKPHLGVPCYLQTHPLIQISPKSSS
ncbi:hypothetical protein ACFX13_009224 [Malus domestica]